MDDKNLNPKPKVNSSAKTREYRAARDPLKLSFPYFPPNSFSLTSNPPIKKAAPTMDDKQAAVTALIQQLEQQKEELKVAGEKVATEIGTQLGLGTPKDLGKDFKKLKKKGYRCPSAETCSNVFCDHTRAVPWADDK
jgi:hypothetical protein